MTPATRSDDQQPTSFSLWKDRSAQAEAITAPVQKELTEAMAESHGFLESKWLEVGIIFAVFDVLLLFQLDKFKICGPFLIIS